MMETVQLLCKDTRIFDSTAKFANVTVDMSYGNC